MIHEPTVFTSRAGTIMEPQYQGDFGRWGERRYSNRWDKNQFHWSSFSNLKDYFFVFFPRSVIINKYLCPSQKQMMPQVIDSILPGKHKNENSVEGFWVGEKAWVNSLQPLINVCGGILWRMEMCHNKCSFGQDHYSCKLSLIFCSHHHLTSSLIQQTMSDKCGGGGLPHSDAKDFLIIKANLGSDTVIYN